MKKHMKPKTHILRLHPRTQKQTMIQMCWGFSEIITIQEQPQLCPNRNSARIKGDRLQKRIAMTRSNDIRADLAPMPQCSSDVKKQRLSGSSPSQPKTPGLAAMGWTCSWLGLLKDYSIKTHQIWQCILIYNSLNSVELISALCQLFSLLKKAFQNPGQTKQWWDAIVGLILWLASIHSPFSTP